jgi:hypothetical protein
MAGLEVVLDVARARRVTGQHLGRSEWLLEFCASFTVTAL